MRKFLQIALLALLLCSIHFIASAQAQPHLSISNDSPTSVQINWTNQVGTTYRLLFTSNLVSSFSLWAPLEDAFSTDTNISVGVLNTNTRAGFFAVEIPTNSGVQIFSPTNGQTVSGTTAVGVGAQVSSQLQGINLYLDNALVGFIDSGGIEFDLDTTHFTNGLHILSVGAVDIANDETPSSSITLDFENPVRWLDADSLFQSFVPITVQSDIFPANWTVTVQDSSNNIVRTFSGSTSNGSIQTNWDGTDNHGASAPDNAAYYITITVSSGSSSIQSFNSAQSLNRLGVQPQAGDSGGSDSTSAAVWREALWSSAETLLARVPFGGIFNTTVQNYFLQIRDFIVAAQDIVHGDRGVYGNNAIYVLNNASDLSTLTNHLDSANPNARAFYFYGHGTTTGDGFGISSSVVIAKDLGAVLGNSYMPFREGQTLSIITHKPFSFVFLDGCNTGKGSLPEAFGIPKISSDVSFNDYHKHKRAFMGWGGIVTFQFSTPQFNWTQSFWNSWLQDTHNYTWPLQQAVIDANTANPGVTTSLPMMIYGSQSLTWSN